MSKVIPIEITISVKTEQSIPRQDIIKMIPIYHEELMADGKPHNTGEFMDYLIHKINL